MERDLHYLLGGSGQPNLGDEWIIQGWLDHLAPTGRRVVVDCNSASQSTFLHALDRPDMRFVTLIKDLCWSQGELDFAGHLKRGFTFFEPGGSATKFPHLDFIWPMFQRVRSFHIYGGGYLNTVWPNHAFHLGIAAALKRRYGFRLYATGQGLVPFARASGEQAELLRSVLREFDLFETRDTASFQFLSEHLASPASLSGTDDTFLAPVRRAERTATNGPVLHFSAYEGTLNKRIAKALQDNRDELRRRYGGFIFWECDPKGDRRAFHTLAAELPELEFRRFQGLMRNGLPVVPGDTLLTIRFHPHLLGARLGANGMFVHDSQYYDVKHRSITELGSGFRVFSEASLPEYLRCDPPVNSLVERQHAMVTEKAVLARGIYP